MVCSAGVEASSYLNKRCGITFNQPENKLSVFRKQFFIDAMIANWQLMLTLTECVGHPKVQNTLKQLVIDGIRHTMELHQEPQLSESARRYFENCTAVTKIFSATTLDAAFVSERA